MYCQCGSRSSIKDTRDSPQGVWRKHQCKSCGVRFHTLEIIAEIPGEGIATFHNIKRGNADRVPIKVRSNIVVATMLSRGKVPTLQATAIAEVSQIARKRIEDLRMEKELKQMDEGNYD